MPLEHEFLLAGRDDLAAYAVAQYPWYEVARHHRVIIDHLEALERGEFLKLAIFTPPQHSKTSTASELFPAWYLGRHPDARVIVVSYGQDRADDFGEHIRALLSTDYHKAIFPDCRLSPTTKSKNDFELIPVFGKPAGACRAAGREASITGLPADLIVLDDLQKDETEARSEAVQIQLRSLMNTVIDARMHPNSRLLFIMTRWDPNDIAGWELENHPKGWKVLSLPNLGHWIEDMDDSRRAALKPEERILLRLPDSQNGTALWPERYPTQWVKENKRDRLLPSQWMALHQQVPNVGGETQTFNPAWHKTISAAQLQDHDWLRHLKLYMVVDPANSKHKKSDYTVMLVVGLAIDRNWYVIDGIRDRMNQAERCDAAFDMVCKWTPVSRIRCVGWEHYGLQTDLEYISDKMKKRNYRFRIEPLGGNVRKEDRINGLTGLYFDGQIHWVDNIPCVTSGERRNLTEDFYRLEFSKYPAVAHDDILDCLARMRDMLALGFANFPTPVTKSDAAFFERRRRIRQGVSFWGR